MTSLNIYEEMGVVGSIPTEEEIALAEYDATH